jgi:hypothetical protein
MGTYYMIDEAATGPSSASVTITPHTTGVVSRTMTPTERRLAVPSFPWSDLPLAPLNGLLAAVPIVVLAGLPLYLVLWLASVPEPERWVGLVLVSSFAFGTATALYTPIAGFLRARARVDDDLLDDMVDDRIVQVTDAVEVVADPPVIYLRLASASADDEGEGEGERETEGEAETIVLKGEYLTRLRRTGRFPSTTLRLIQLPRSRAVVGILPLGDDLHPAFLSSQDHRPAELDGEPSQVDIDALRSRGR